MDRSSRSAPRDEGPLPCRLPGRGPANAPRDLLHAVDRWGKPAAALLTYLGVVSVTDQAFIEAVIGEALPAVRHQAPQWRDLLPR
jgi:hypothetical protein